jgi:nucleoid-associated protein YgaU
MALQSQTINAGTRSQFMMSRTRRRRPRRWPFAAIAIVGVSGLAWLLWPSGGAAPDPSDSTAIDPLLVATAERPPTRDVRDLDRASSSRSTPPIALTPEPNPRRTPPASAPTEPSVAIAEPTPTPIETPTALERPSAPKADPVLPVLTATEVVPAPDRTNPSAARTGRVSSLVALADQDPVEARAALTEAYVSGSLSPAEERLALETLERINARLLFSPEPVQNDPFSRIYLVQPGDSLERIAKRELAGGPDWRFVQRMNRIKNPRAIQVNQRLKLPVGTFHAVVHKRDFRMDVFLVNNGDRVLVASYPVGLGELNSTPEGLAKVRKGSKLIDPEWYNPRTGEYFAAGDPKNPIGEHWIGLSSSADGDRLFDGYGIHGTIEPGSIGQSVSMGCVRLLPEHVEVVYEVLTEPESTVEVRP